MATMYVGYHHIPVDSPVNAHLRENGTLPAELDKKRREFPASLPPTCKLIGSYAVLGPAPNVLIVEVESIADLNHISSYYAGWIDFDWNPCVPMPRD